MIERKLLHFGVFDIKLELRDSMKLYKMRYDQRKEENND